MTRLKCFYHGQGTGDLNVNNVSRGFNGGQRYTDRNRETCVSGPKINFREFNLLLFKLIM